MRFLRLVSGIAILVLTLGPAVPMVAADTDVRLRLEPHCMELDRSNCPQFDVSDALHLVSGQYTAGDIVDIDVVLTGGTGKSIQLVRSWLQYDPQMLSARSVDLTSAIAQPIPDEQTFDVQAGLIKIGGNAALNLAGDRISIARVTFRVISTAKDTVLSFVNFREDGSGQTAVNAGGSDSTAPLLAVSPSILTVKLADAGNTSSASVVSSASSASSATIRGQTQSSSQSAVAASAFSLLQVQDVRVTSRGSSIFLGWQALRSSELKGYNVYYGTISGRYMQRRAIPATAGSLVIRDLTPGTPYYLAIRGVNQSDLESVFSQEVSVTVDDPDTSTSPLAAGIDGFDPFDELRAGKLRASRLTTSKTPPPRGNPIENHNGNEINGSTGTGDTVLMLALLSSVIGTAFAAHRQRALSTAAHVT